jgi:hypothetical protein
MTSAQTAEIKAISSTQLQSFAERYLWLLIGIGVVVLVFVFWLYYYDWRRSRDFRRHWEGKRRRG